MSEKNFLCYGDAETLLTELEVKLEEKANASDLATVATSGLYSDLSGTPTLGTAAAKDAPSSGNASSTQVVMGNDTRLTNARPASDVSAWAKASTKPSYTASEVGAIATTAKGAANGVAELDSAGKVPSSQLPSYVDDVLEYNSTSAFPATGETGKIYVAKDTNKTYRWSGTAYVEISPSLALGETSSTAYRGDRGKTAYDHSQLTSGNPHNVTKSDVGLGNVPNVSTNDQTPTFTQASSRANIASGEKLSVIFGKVMKFFSDLKTVAFSGSYTDLTNKPTISKNFQGTIEEWNALTTEEKKTYDHASIPNSISGDITFPANKVIMTDGETSIEEAVDELNSSSIKYGYAECSYAAGTKRNALITIYNYISTLFDGQKHINLESISLSGLGYFGNLYRTYETSNHNWELFQPVSYYNDSNYKFIHTAISLKQSSALSVIAGLGNGNVYVADQSNDSISAGVSKITYTWY